MCTSNLKTDLSFRIVFLCIELKQLKTQIMYVCVNKDIFIIGYFNYFKDHIINHILNCKSKDGLLSLYSPCYKVSEVVILIVCY